MFKLAAYYTILTVAATLLSVVGTMSVGRASEITLHIFIESEDELLLPGIEPFVQKGQDENQLEFLDHFKTWVHNVIFGEELTVPLLIGIKGNPLPKGVEFSRFNFDAPVYEVGKTFVVKLAPVKSDGSARTVRELHGTNIRKLNKEDLPVFFQKARAAALWRMKHLDEQWHRLSDYHVQAVFKYLETVRELHRETYLVAASNEVARGRDWLRTAISQKPTRVGAAILGDSRAETGLDDAKLLVRQINALEGWRFHQLWEYAKAPSTCDKRYPLLISYKSAFFELPEDKAKRIAANIGVYRGTVLSAIAQCVSTNIRCHNGRYEGGENELGARDVLNLVSEIGNELVTTYESRLETKLKSDLKVLKSLATSIDQSHPMRCPTADR